MTWFKVDDQFHSHPKTLATPPAALGLWVVAGSWSSAHLTEGVVPDRVLPSLLEDSATLARALVKAGLWKRVRGGYKFHNWTDFNPSAEEARALHEKRAEAGRKGGLTSAKRKANAVANGQALAQQVAEPPTFSSVRAKDAGGRSRGSPPAPNPKRKPAWCGVCDQDTRLTGPPDAPYRCEECHPISGRRARQ